MAEKKITVPFAVAALAWAIISFGLCRFFSQEAGAFQRNLSWLFGLWALCLLDLTALGKAVKGLLAFAASDTQPIENRAIYAVQTFSWVVIMLACLGIFALIIVYKGTAAPIGLLLGLGTLVFVPVIGGLIWSQGAEVLGNGE